MMLRSTYLDCYEGASGAENSVYHSSLPSRWKVRFYEDWGVNELIVEDSWKRQVGGG
ncbi:hypothetical protein Pint_17390 [Pistacia integerrima]|uniref:Uncharacterized protein n=2 Tax=Pistacia TaxID=55512 RepID=A0ACC1BLM4_9ROSI|nr:hypothetical protein Pint_17390 [Pistacia integerrima]KAJ0099853.1 hypothetical protein Patl1_20074 [Pistacia atlantica]